jgi:N-acetyl-alpha-D-glucosaminyl L-malate synthase BshA
MRIGIVCHPGVGGSAVVASELAGALHRSGETVFVYAPARPFRLPEGPTYRPLFIPDHPVFPAPSLGLAVAEQLAAAVEGDGLEVLHVHYAVPLAASAVLAAELLGPRAAPAVVVTVHGSDVTGSPGRDFARTTAWALTRATRVTAPSRALAVAVPVDGVVQVIPNFVPPPVGPPAPLDEPRLVHVSNLRPVKRPLDLVGVLALLTRSDACLRVVGDGPERAALERAAAEAGLADRVELVGFRREVGPLLHDGSVFLLPSASESFGLAAVEAMAAGLPVIATRTGGLPDVLEDGAEGFLHEVGDLEGMAESAERLLADAALRRRMGAAARRRAARFAEGPVVAAYRQMYRDASSASPRSFSRAPLRVAASDG